MNFEELILNAQRIAKKFRFLKTIPVSIALFFWEILRANYEGWIKPYIQWVVPFIKWAKNKFIRAKRSVHSSFSGITNFIRNSFQSFKNVLQSRLENLTDRGIHVLSGMKKRFLWALKKSALPFVKTGGLIKGALAKISLSMQKGFSLVKSFSVRIKDSLVKFPNKLVSLAEIAISKFMKFLREAATAVRNLYILMKVLIRVGIHYIKTI